MPELVEVDRYRELAAARALGRPVEAVEACDLSYLRRGADIMGLREVLVGGQFVEARRKGKLLLLDVSHGAVLGVHFGMSGRLVVDGVAAVDQLLYSPRGQDIRYQRFAVRFVDGGSLTVHDPRRLGGVELNPDQTRLGTDALTITLVELRAVLGTSPTPLKARLLDQARLAGVGNLIADEILWRAGLAPGRPVAGLSDAAVRRLHRHLGQGLADLIERGGSHTGDLMPERRIGGRCPRDGTPLSRAVVGGRTTWWCPRHQR